MLHPDFSNINSRKFEKMCFEYAKKIYKDENAKIVLTKAQKDGGRDIEITIKDNNDLLPIIHWGECKAHKRNIDLSTIGKNIVLVLSKKIKKIIFFSTSSIVLNTKRTILEVARDYGFDVEFIDGEFLVKEFNNNQILLINEVKNLPKHIIETKILAYEYNFDNNIVFNENVILKLVGSSHFIITIMMKNCIDYDIEVKIKFAKTNFTKIFIKPLKKTIQLHKHSDIAISFDCYCMANYLETEQMPDIIIEGAEQEIFKCQKLGKIKIDFMPETPLVGAVFQQHIYDIIKIVSQKSHNNYIDIQGTEGSGKTRLISETVRFLSENEYKIFHYCGKDFKNIFDFRELISYLAQIPYYNGETIEIESFSRILNDKKIAQSDIAILYEYMTCEHYCVSSKLNSYLSLLKSLLFSNYCNEPIAIIFDDINYFDVCIVDFVCDFVCNLTSVERKNGILLITAANYQTEFQVNYNHLMIFRQRTLFYHNMKNDHAFICEQLSDQEKILLCQEILGTDHKYIAIIKNIAIKFAGNPGLLINVCQYVKRYHSEAGDYKVDETIYNGNDEIEKNNYYIVLKNIDALAGNKEFIIEILSYIILFDDNMPCEFYNTSYSSIQILKENRLIRYKNNTDSYELYQKCYIEIVKDIIGKNVFERSAHKVLEWIYKNNLTHKYKFVIFNCLLQLGENEKAFSYGYDIIDSDNINSTEFKMIDVIESLLLISDSTELYKRFRIQSKLAHLNLFNYCFSKGVKCFEEAYMTAKHLIEIKELDEKQFFHIRHEYINSMIHNGSYKQVLNFINSMEPEKIDSDIYYFLAYNRLGVIHTFLDDTASAYENLSIAEKTALKMNDPFWISTIQSDYGYLYLKTNNPKNAISFFKDACQEYDKCSYKEIYRDIEIYCQSALYKALENKLSEALVDIKNAIEICESYHKEYSLLKAEMIHAFILVKSQEYTDAEKIYNMCIEKAIIYRSSIYNLYFNAALATLYMLTNNKNEAYNLYTEVSKIASFNRFEGINGLISIFENFVLWFFIEQNQDNALKIIEDNNLPEIENYLFSLRTNELSDSFCESIANNAANIKGYNFLF